MGDVLILGIESSCDETAAAIVKNGREVLSNVIFSQVPTHTIYGGVVPEIASRQHIEKINPVVDEAVKQAGVSDTDLTAVGVTYGPGLVGPLLVGVSFAKGYSFAKKLPLVGVNHIEGHICSNLIEYKNLNPPFLCLVVSGGHTHLVIMEDHGIYKILGRTMDDAAGESYDKVARAIGLGYPGGPKIDEAAKKGDPKAIDFPRAKIAGNEYSFSFSGLKSAVLNYLNSCTMSGKEINRNDVAASFQAAVVDVLVESVRLALKNTGIKKFALAGGVASNSALRTAMGEMCKKTGVDFFVPPPVLCTDNGAMIASAAYFKFIEGRTAGLDLNAVPNLKLGQTEVFS
ncbi:MAG: tRNA (adenosine(37)-N6)-threonylcarbamoyltransferase complex transferase subunit TsaD [Lachnospiraceae bacterium]|nr:tRNA (adenosine(37)-N6)-threonylcarbamoyltransferase complex transferase subunit TsaD [Lachnospiraceae bacterium]